MKRYVRLIPSKKVRDAISEAAKERNSRRIKAFPKEVTCHVCYKKIKVKNAIWQDGKDMSHKSFWMCIEHNSSYQLNPLAFIMQKKSYEMTPMNVG